MWHHAVVYESIFVIKASKQSKNRIAKSKTQITLNPKKMETKKIDGANLVFVAMIIVALIMIVVAAHLNFLTIGLIQ